MQFVTGTCQEWSAHSMKENPKVLQRIGNLVGEIADVLETLLTA
ncbi:hypothetical protein [Nocardia sp. NPDC057440]